MQKGWNKWTAEMDSFLLENYEWIGDSHLATMFGNKFPKGYPWTCKHIEKRRNYLGLKRTAEQLYIIRYLNNQDGRQMKTWDKRGRMKLHEVREWNGLKFIKTKNGVILHRRHLANAKPGQIVRTFEGGIKVIDRATHARMNKEKSLQWPEELKQTIKALNQLKKIVYGKEDFRSERNPV